MELFLAAGKSSPESGEPDPCRDVALAEANYDDMYDICHLSRFTLPVQEKLKQFKTPEYTPGTQNLFEVYFRSNSRALDFQKKRNNLGYITAFFGVILILLSIINALKLIENILLVYTEIALFAIVVIGFLIGRFFDYHGKWLLERHKAERCRFLKFQEFICPHRDLFNRNLEQIQQIKDETGIIEWIVAQDIRPDKKCTSLTLEGINRTEAKEYLRYYFCRRLFLQMSFYWNRYQKFKNNRCKWVKFIPLVLFFLGLIFGAVNIFFELLTFGVSYDVGFNLRYSFALVLALGTIPIVSSAIHVLIYLNQFHNQTTNYLVHFIGLYGCIHDELLGMPGTNSNDLVKNELEKLRGTWKCIRSQIAALEKTIKRCFGVYHEEQLSDESPAEQFLAQFERSCRIHPPVTAESGGMSVPDREIGTDPDIVGMALDKFEKDPERLVRILFQCEDLMQREHQQWIELMKEANWVG